LTIRFRGFEMYDEFARYNRYFIWCKNIHVVRYTKNGFSRPTLYSWDHNYRRTSHRTPFACSLPLLLADSRYSVLHNWPERELTIRSKSCRSSFLFALRILSRFSSSPSRLLHAANRGTARMPRYGSVARFYLDCASIAKYVDPTDRSISIQCGRCNSVSCRRYQITSVPRSGLSLDTTVS